MIICAMSCKKLMKQGAAQQLEKPHTACGAVQ